MVARLLPPPDAEPGAPPEGGAGQLFVLSGARAYTVPLGPGGVLRIGRGKGVDVELADAELPSRVLLELALQPGDRRPQLRVLEGAPVFLNEVQVTAPAPTWVRVGDLINLAESVLLWQSASTPGAVGRALLPYEGFELQLQTHVTRAAQTGRPFVLWAMRSRALVRPAGMESLLAEVPAQASVLGAFAQDVWLALLPDATLTQSEAWRERMAGALDGLKEPSQWGWAAFPQDGVDAHALLGHALERLLADDLVPGEEPLRVDPVMARLYQLLDRLASLSGPFLLRGEASVGKEVFAHALHQRAGPADAPFVAFTCAEFSDARFELACQRAQGGTLYLRHLPALPAAARASLGGLAHVRQVWSAPPEEGTQAPVTLYLPSLRERPLEILPLAESFLAHAGARLGRRNLTLAPPTQRLLEQDAWPGNLRELKNAMVRAALLTDGEIRPEHLPPRVLRERAPEPDTGLRASLQATEREVLLEALARTQWNVTAAARRLGLPRRTVVYRMSRLGLRRPGK